MGELAQSSRSDRSLEYRFLYEERILHESVAMPFVIC